MTQTIKQRSTLKVAIGSRYTGPCLDRPALRQMPRHWQLEESKPVRNWMPSADRCVAIAVVLAYVFAVAQTLVDFAK